MERDNSVIACNIDQDQKDVYTKIRKVFKCNMPSTLHTRVRVLSTMARRSVPMCLDSSQIYT